MTTRRQQHVPTQFQRLADEMIRRTERISCSLDDRIRGLMLMQECVETMLKIVSEERLKS